MHLMIGDMLRMMVFEGDDWWFEMNYTLQAIAWMLRTTVPSTIPYSPSTLAFNYNMIMQTKVKVGWKLIKKKRQENMLKSNIKENKAQIEHVYKVDSKVLIVKLRDQQSTDPKLSKPTEGPTRSTEFTEMEQ
mmetsp:Transcript_5670/g.8319  ORF Transcript_5670/g.8319 Transcript_5670/m.8319 type:complete len:132 (+) Transcript_5670:3599-3994(+)